MKFIKGIDLCKGFFFEIAKPILDNCFPELSYSAGLIGYGSDVLGYDDEVSTDHMWGPRFYLFLSGSDMSIKQEIIDAFGRLFPFDYKGYSVNFSQPNADDGGVRVPKRIAEGRVSPLIFIHTIDEYLTDYLGTADLDRLTSLDWLSFSEHRLLALTSGKIFFDGINIQKIFNKLRHYPDDIRLYLIASNWSLIAEEQAYVRRCFDVGDNLGSILVCGRIAERLMRLSFLYCNKYAPYSKWFGKAFSLLPIDENIKKSVVDSVSAATIDEREKNIVAAQKLLADLHNRSGITEPVDVQIENYFNRDIKVIFTDKIAAATMKKLADTPFERYPLIGTFSGVANFTSLFDDPARRLHVKMAYGE